MRAELDGLKSEMRGVQARLGNVESRLETVESKLDRTMKVAAGLSGDMVEVKRTLAQHGAALSQLGPISAKLDVLISWREESRYEWAKHKLRLDDHETRLSRLERRRRKS